VLIFRSLLCIAGRKFSSLSVRALYSVSKFSRKVLFKGSRARRDFEGFLGSGLVVDGVTVSPPRTKGLGYPPPPHPYRNLPFDLGLVVQPRSENFETLTKQLK
jgi:hypothetical protein